MLAEFLTARADVRFGGRSWPAVVTYGVLLAIERDSGVPLLAAPPVQAPSASFLRAWLYHVLQRSGYTGSITDVGNQLAQCDRAAVHASLLAGWIASMPEPEPPRQGTGAGKARPRTWLQVYSFATSPYGLGLSESAWLAMTPRMLHALSEERLERIRQEEEMQGKIIAAVINFGARAPREPVKAKAFMTHPWPEEPASPGDELRHFFGAWNQEHKSVN